MTGEQYLKQARIIEIKIKRREKMIEDIREVVAGSGGIDYSALRVDHSAENNSMNMVDRLIDLTYELREEKKELVKKKADIVRRIERINEAKYIEFLELRYIDGLQIEEIAERMGYVEGYARHLHRKALTAFEDANPDIINSSHNITLDSATMVE